jgi:hypothetical protein
MYLKTLLIENHNKVNRNLIKNFWFQFSAEKYFSLGFKEKHLKNFNKKCGMKNLYYKFLMLKHISVISLFLLFIFAI